MQIPKMSIHHKRLETAFGHLYKGTLENSADKGLKFTICRCNKPILRSAILIGLLILGSIGSLIAFTVLLIMRNQLISKISKYLKEDGMTVRTDATIKGNIEKNGYTFISDNNGFQEFFKNKIDHNDRIKMHISVQKTGKNMEKASIVISSILQKYNVNTFKVLLSKFSGGGKELNQAGKAFTVYFQSKETEESVKAIIEEISTTLEEKNITKGIPALADMPICKNGYIFSRNSYNLDNKYVGATDLMNWGFTRFEAATIGSSKNIMGVEIGANVFIRDFTKEMKKTPQNAINWGRSIKLYSIPLLLCTRGPEDDYDVYQGFKDILQEVHDYFYSTFDEKDEMGCLYPGIYHAIIKPLNRLIEERFVRGPWPTDVEGEKKLIAEYLIDNKDYITKYLLDCAMRTKDFQIHEDQPKYLSIPTR